MCNFFSTTLFDFTVTCASAVPSSSTSKLSLLVDSFSVAYFTTVVGAFASTAAVDDQEYSTVVVDCADLTSVVDCRDSDTVAGMLVVVRSQLLLMILLIHLLLLKLLVQKLLFLAKILCFLLIKYIPLKYIPLLLMITQKIGIKSEILFILLMIVGI